MISEYDVATEELEEDILRIVGELQAKGLVEIQNAAHPSS